MQPAPEIILNVNDNEAGRYVTSRILRSAGFNVLEAGTGEQALRMAHEYQPPLVVIDVNLPDISGVEVCRRLKSDQSTSFIMVLQVSATNIGVADRVNSLAAGADSFLVEPVEPEELAAVARALLRLYRSEAALRRALAEREMLLKEVNHRVKNSLQLVLSMLSLQGHRFPDPQTRELFAKAIARVTAIASIHERLYQDVDPLTVEMQSYLTGLCAELTRAVGIDEESRCSLAVEVEPLRLPTEQGVATALIVNELVMNSLKHARPTSGTTAITVRLARHGASHTRLTVFDNGELPSASSESQKGLGTHLIRMLARQLNGELSFDSVGGGYGVHVTFPAQAPASPS